MSYTSKYTGTEIDNLLSSIGVVNSANEKGYGMYHFIQDSNCTTITELFHTPHILDGYLGTDLSNLDKDESGRPILKAGKTYKISFIPAAVTFTSSNGVFYGRVTDKASARIFGCSMISTGATSGVATSNTVGLYRPEEDVPLMVFNGTESTASYNISKVEFFLLIEEVSNDISVTNNSPCASNPIGSIIPIIGTEAPQDYLVCDGSELNINEYKELADYFEAQFGSKNHFGGDGVNTFTIPDLRNEFLRGYGELSGEIGIHQNATEIPNIWYSVNGDLAFHTGPLQQNGAGIRKYADTMTKDTSSTGGKYTSSMGNWTGGDKTATYTTRPTNVAVLFCIKYTESGSIATEEQIAVKLTNGSELVVDKVNSIVMFDAYHQLNFPVYTGDRWYIIGTLPEGYRPKREIGFPVNMYSPNTIGYGVVRPNGEIAFYTPQNTTNLTQLYFNVSYKN